jgi:hypothetical protein
MERGKEVEHPMSFIVASKEVKKTRPSEKLSGVKHALCCMGYSLQDTGL